MIQENEAPVAKVLTAADTFGDSIDTSSDLDDLAIDDEATSVQVDLPTVFALPDLQESRWTIRLYSANCLRCDELIDGGDYEGLKAKCHHSRKNPYCPAMSTRFDFVGAKLQMLALGQQAKAAGDAAKMLQFMSKLSAKDEDVQKFVLAELGLLG